MAKKGDIPKAKKKPENTVAPVSTYIPKPDEKEKFAAHLRKLGYQANLEKSIVIVYYKNGCFEKTYEELQSIVESYHYEGSFGVVPENQKTKFAKEESKEKETDD